LLEISDRPFGAGARPLRRSSEKKGGEREYMLAAMVIVTRVQPGTSKGITDLLLPQPSTVSQSAVPLV